MEWVGDKVMGSGEGWANWRIYGCYMKKAGTQLQKLVSCGNAGTALPDVLGFFFVRSLDYLVLAQSKRFRQAKAAMGQVHSFAKHDLESPMTRLLLVH